MRLKKYVYGLSAGVLLIWVLIFTRFLDFTADEELADQTANVFEIGPLAHPDQIEQHPYFIFMALNASLDRDANVLGRELYRCYWERWQQPNILDLFLMNESEDACLAAYTAKQKTISWGEQEKKLIQQLRGGDFNRIHASSVLENKALIKDVVRRYSKLLERVSMINRGYAQSSTIPFVVLFAEENHRLLLDVQLLKLYSLWLDKDVRQMQWAQEQLMRAYHHQQDTLLKAMYWALNVVAIDLLHDLNSSSTAPLLNNLTQDQLSLASWFLDERYLFYKKAYQFQDVRTRDLYLDNVLGLKDIPWQYKLVRGVTFWNEFRLNMTLNHYANYHQQMVMLSKLPEGEFRNRIGQFSFEVDYAPLIIEKNYLGVLLVNYSIPVVEEWVVLPRLLNQKIKLFNVLHAGKAVDLVSLNQNDLGEIYYIQDDLLCIKHYLEKDKRTNLMKYAAGDMCLPMYGGYD